jgi:ATP-dependent Clp protease ATP-binding subunit ClpA
MRLFGTPAWAGQPAGQSPAPLLAQANLNRFHSEENPLSIVLFDEIEKASDLLWQCVLSAVDKGRITLADGRTVDFSQSIIILTSNVGAREITDAINGGAGFKAGSSDDAVARERATVAAALRAARERFSPEFLNRVDETVVFEPLESDDLRQIVRLEIGAIEQRIRARYDAPFTLEYTEAALDLLLAQGTDRRSYARNLKRAIDRLLVAPLSALFATEQITPGDVVRVDAAAEDAALVFERSPDEAALPALERDDRAALDSTALPVNMNMPAKVIRESPRGEAAMQQLAATMSRAGLA